MMPMDIDFVVRVNLFLIDDIGNHLRHLDEYTFRDLSLRSFYVHENPLVCDCHMRWLINYLKSVDYQQQAYESQNAMTFYEQTAAPKSKYTPAKTVAEAAQALLRCDQPNSLKASDRFLDINPDSFMCDVEIQFRNEVCGFAMCILVVKV